MDFSQYFPVWDKLTADEQRVLSQSAVRRSVKKGTVLHRGLADCLGLLVVGSGQLRVYSVSDDGREVTLYRLFERDICLLSASCMIESLQFDVIIEAEKDTGFWVVPPAVYKGLMERSAEIANYTSQIMATHFSEVMWLMEQIMWKTMDKRLASFLAEESALEGGSVLKLTHERIASHLGTAREVVTRLLRYFQNEGILRLSRGSVEILDMDRLSRLSD